MISLGLRNLVYITRIRVKESSVDDNDEGL